LQLLSEAEKKGKERNVVGEKREKECYGSPLNKKGRDVKITTARKGKKVILRTEKKSSKRGGGRGGGGELSITT